MHILLWYFGSYTRNHTNEDSDLDIFIVFTKPMYKELVASGSSFAKAIKTFSQLRML